MFTGIIKEMGTIKRVEKTRGGLRLEIKAADHKLYKGSSLAVNGVCLTVRVVDPLVKPEDDGFVVFDVMPETLKVTTLGSLKVGDRVNLEPALKYGDELGGHLVLGHVDGVGKVVARKKQGSAVVLTISCPRALGKYIVRKGSIAVDGVSLTVIKNGSKFQVSLVSYTLDHTNLDIKKIGDYVNLEIDVLARYAL